MTVQEWTIHPDSKLGTLRSAVEAARTIREAGTQQRAAYASELNDQDRWLDAADETTKLAEYANKTARRSILLNLNSKLERHMAAQAQEIKPLEAEYGRMSDVYIEKTRALVLVNDLANPFTRRMSLDQIEQTRRDMTAWLQDWTQPESVLVEV